MVKEELIKYAQTARKNAYAPYSGFKVGAALLTSDEKVYLGCNIENASFGATMCAERVALFNAVANGEKSFSAIALVGGKKSYEEEAACTPCGICRQTLSEFCEADFKIYLIVPNGNIAVYTLAELFPSAFSKKNLL